MLQFSAVAAGSDPLHWSVVGPPNLGVQVDIPKGFVPKSILKRHYAWKFYPEGSLFRNLK